MSTHSTQHTYTGGMSEADWRELPAAERIECPDCGHRCSTANLATLRRAWERVQPGDTMPDGECPECGAACYVEELEPSNDTERQRLELLELRRLVAILAEHAGSHAEDWRSGLDDGTYTESEGLEELERALERATELEAGAPPLPPPVYVIGVQGGIVQGMSVDRITADRPRIIVCDWDARDDEGLEIGDSRANVYEPGASLEADFVGTVAAAIDAADAELESEEA